MANDRDKGNSVADAQESAMGDEQDVGAGEAFHASAPEPSRAVAGRRFNLFRMYKPNQGKQIRLWSAIGSGLLICGGWLWAVPKLQVSFSAQREWLAPVIALAVSAVIAAVVWWLVGVNRKSVDFLIATESEMKKVTWSSRKEVWGATKVVIGMVIFLAFGLFCVDFGFTWFFWKIGVLKAPF
jgi:preprotein translocase subunit SecE